MLRFMSIRSRLVLLSLLLVATLIGTNLVLIHQTRLQNDLIRQQADHIDIIVRADAAIQTFGDLKYWLTDLAVSQLVLSEQKAQAANDRLKTQLVGLEQDVAAQVFGLPQQLEQLNDVSMSAVEAYGRNDRLVGNAMMARGRAHILAIDSRLSALVGDLRSAARQAADTARARTDRRIQFATSTAAVVTLVGALLTFLILRSVVGPLRGMVGAIRAMTAGNMNVPIPPAQRDEVGEVAKVLKLFRENVVRREEAEKTEVRLRQVIENISDAFALYDSDDRLVLSNRQYRERLRRDGLSSETRDLTAPGASFEAVLRATVDVGIVPDAVGREEDWIKERLTAHRNPRGPLIQPRRDGTWLQINEHRTDDGGTVAIYTDISDLKRQEAEVAEKTAVLEATLENMGEGISMFDADLKLILHNKRFLEIWDYPPDRFRPGSELHEFFEFNASRGDYGTDEVDREVRERLNLAKQFEPQVLERTRPNGMVIEIRRIPFPGGGFVATYTDVTDRKRVEESLREANLEKDTVLAELQAVLDAIQYGILFMDADLNIRMHNRAYREIWNLPEDFFAGRPSFRDDMALTRDTSLCSESEDEWEAFVDRRIEEVKAGDSGPGEVHLTDGRVLQSRCLCLPDGGRMLTYFDITELMRVQQELTQARDLAEVASEAKSKFLANMSHELRTPLNAIIGITEMLQEEAGDLDCPEFDEPLNRIHRAGKHLLRLIEEILDLSRIEAGRLELRPETFAIAAIVEDIANTVEPLAELNRNNLVISCPDDIGEMRADPLRLKQVVFNLMSNACKFTENGEVCLSAAREHDQGRDWITFTVQDNGIGIDPQLIGDLFQEFSQVDATANARFGGTGLGLAISRRLCRSMGGEISASSAPGEGSTFTVRFPA